MSLTVEQALGQKLMLSFTGAEPSAEILALLSRQHVGGLTLYRARNVESPAQVRALTAALQRAAAASGQPPLLIAADQEGGTLLALVGTTPFPGNLALGAAGSPELARRTGHAWVWSWPRWASTSIMPRSAIWPSIRQTRWWVRVRLAKTRRAWPI